MPLPSIPEYSTAIKTPALIHPTVLQGGHPVEKNNRMIRYSGGFCVVFPYETPSRKYAVRCWHAEVADAKKRTQIIAQALKDSKLPYFVGFEYYEKGIMAPQGMQPLVVMDWVDAKALKKFIGEHLNESATLNNVAENFKVMVADLHAHKLAHGDLQHGNIMVRQDCSLVLVDYDSMYTPSLDGMVDEIKGLVGYQHPSRWKNQHVSPKADYFSELVIYLSLKALAKYPRLWSELQMEDTETLLFSGEDIESKGSTPIFSLLKGDSELAPMVDKLCEFMRKNSIDDLDPLEDAVIPNSVKVIGGIAGKWKNGNGYVKQPPKPAKVDDAGKIAGKWGAGRTNVAQASLEKRENLAKSISEKFKKTE